MSADLLARLIEAGTPAALVGEVAMALGRLEAEREAAANADRRSPAAIKQQRYRDRQRAQDVTDGNDVTESVTSDGEGNAAPAPNKKTPDPKKLTPTPCVPDTPTREEPGSDQPDPLSMLIAWMGWETVLHAALAKRWKGMPPPVGVTAEQWRGFVDHRKSIRHTLTPRAYDLLCAKLTKQSSDEWPPGRIIDTIVERGWRSFELDWITKAENRHGQRNHHHDRTAGHHPGGRTGSAADHVFGGGASN